MKNIYRFLLSVALFTCFSFSAEAQYRRYQQPRERSADLADSNEDTRGRSNRNRRSTRTRRNNRRPPRTLPARTEEFDFQIYYTSMNVLLDMQLQIDAAHRAAVDRWLRQQEENFRKEINRQLGTRHSTFGNAQRDFFKKFEKNFKRVESRARSVASSHSGRARSLDKEQEQHTNDFNLIEEWRHLRDVCSPRGIVDCNELSNTKVRNTRLGSTGLGTLDRLWDGSLKDFSKKEYGAALHRSWARGMYRIVDDGSLTTEMMNKHIANYNRKGLQDKVFLMTTYLTQYNNRGRGVMSVPITKYRLPDFWNSTTLLNMGKKKAPSLTDSQRIFKDNFFENEAERCNSRSSSHLVSLCARNYERLEKLRDDIILEHREAMLSHSEFGMTLKLNKLRKGYRRGNGSGKIGGLDALSYKNWTPDGTGPNANRFYQLNNGSWVYRSNSAREVNNGVSFSEPSLNDDGYFYYIFNDGTKRWHELLLPATGVSTTSDPYLVQAFWKGMKGVARYATPIEDVIVFIDGKDFDNNEVSQAEAGVWLVVGFIPGGKILKPVTRGAGKLILFAKAGNKTIKLGFKKGGEAFNVLQNARKLAGRATGNGVAIKNKWLKGSDGNAGFFPKSIADKMRGKNYPNFDKFREDFWRNVANDPKLANQFSKQNQALMKNGKAPKVKNIQTLGEHNTYQLHHNTPINKGGKVYDFDNLTIVTPRYHKEILSPAYHLGYGY